MSQQEFSYFDPEHETVYEARDINHDPRESYEVQEEIVHYVTPEHTMLSGEKLIPTNRTRSYSNWFVTALFILMILISGLLWGVQVFPYSPSGYGPPSPSWTSPSWNDRHHHSWNDEQWRQDHPMPPQDNDWP